jgi:hypothetical protein
MATAQAAAELVLKEDYDAATPMIRGIAGTLDVKGDLNRQLSMTVQIKSLGRKTWWQDTVSEQFASETKLPSIEELSVVPNIEDVEIVDADVVSEDEVGEDLVGQMHKVRDPLTNEPRNFHSAASPYSGPKPTSTLSSTAHPQHGQMWHAKSSSAVLGSPDPNGHAGSIREVHSTTVQKPEGFYIKHVGVTGNNPHYQSMHAAYHGQTKLGHHGPYKTPPPPAEVWKRHHEVTGLHEAFDSLYAILHEGSIAAVTALKTLATTGIKTNGAADCAADIAEDLKSAMTILNGVNRDDAEETSRVFEEVKRVVPRLLAGVNFLNHLTKPN